MNSRSTPTVHYIKIDHTKKIIKLHWEEEVTVGSKVTTIHHKPEIHTLPGAKFKTLVDSLKAHIYRLNDIAGLGTFGKKISKFDAKEMEKFNDLLDNTFIEHINYSGQGNTMVQVKGIMNSSNGGNVKIETPTMNWKNYTDESYEFIKEVTDTLEKLNVIAIDHDMEYASAQLELELAA